MYRRDHLLLVGLVILSLTTSGHILKPAYVSTDKTDCLDLNVMQNFGGSEIVFSGRVTSIDTVQDQELVTFALDKLWKGNNTIQEWVRVIIYKTGDRGCLPDIEVGKEYIYYGYDATSNYENSIGLADSRTGKIYFERPGTKPLAQGEFDLRALAFIVGENSRDFVISDTLEGNEYSISGRHSDGIQIRELDITPGWGLALSISTARESDEFMELSLSKAVIDGIHSLEILREDYSTGTDGYEIETENATIITVVVPAGTNNVQMKGTHVIPEFDSSVAALLMAVSTAGLLAWSVGTARRSTIV